ETVDQSGAPVNEQFVTLFFRGPFEGDGGGEPAPDHKLTAAVKAAPPLAEVTYRFDEDQTFRYAEASGDPVPIHLDDAAARAVADYGAEFAAVLEISRVWVNGNEPTDGLNTPVGPSDEVAVLPPVSGG